MSNDKIGSCPFCKVEYVITEDIAGIVVACPSPECGKQFTAGAAEAESSSPAETTSVPPADTNTSASPTTGTSSEGRTKTPPAETTKKTPPAETTKKTPPAETTGSKLRPIKEDDFQTVHPDELIDHLSQSPILKTFTFSLFGHVALIVLLSIGNFVMCVKYGTFSVTGAVKEHAEALKEEKVAEKKAVRAKAQAAQKVKRDAQAKIDGPETAKNPAGAKTSPEREPSAIEKELSETSSERPSESSISLDDSDEGL